MTFALEASAYRCLFVANLSGIDLSHAHRKCTIDIPLNVPLQVGRKRFKLPLRPARYTP